MTKIITHTTFSNLDPNLCHGFGTKFLGVDFDALSKLTGIPVEKIFFLKQIHSNRVSFIDFSEKHWDPRGGSAKLLFPTPPVLGAARACEALRRKNSEPARTPTGSAFQDGVVDEGDALITTQTDCLIGVRTADCMPILVYSAKPKVIAAIHAGWQGILAGIIQSTVQKMVSDFHCDPKNLFFLFGPCLRVENFAMDDEVIERFRQVYKNCVAVQQFEKTHLEAVQTAKNILEDLNCDRKKIFDVNFCTYEREDLFFSYRRGHLTERQFHFIGLLSSEWKCGPEENDTRESRQDKDLK